MELLEIIMLLAENKLESFHIFTRIVGNEAVTACPVLQSILFIATWAYF
ncbi:MAG: hypothetical protein IPF54_26050 [Draconibacterium sp.]|nr:hypothetical protein [Draconibacterium sp.]